MKLNKRLAVVLFLISVQLACKDDQIRKAARASDDMATAISLTIDLKRSLAASGVLKPEEEIPLTLALQKVNTAAKAFHTQVAATSKFDPAAKNKLLTLFEGIATSVNELNQQGVLGIKDPEARTKISTVLVGVSSALASIKVALGGV